MAEPAEMEMAEPAAALLTMRMRGRIQAATTANVTETAPKADRTYEREWRKFKAFVDAERDGQGNRLPQGDKYLTRNAVDLYFSTVIAHRTTVMPESARRVVSSLQFFAKNKEFIDGDEEFVVDSHTVSRSLGAQKQRYFEHIATQELSEPHANLPTNVLNDEEHERVLNEIFTNCSQNWQDLAFSWTLCTQSYVRNDSARKFMYCDLVLDTAHGPEKRGELAKILSIVLRQGRHKYKQDKTRIVGGWRHRNYLRCMTGMLGMCLLVNLHSNRDLDFYMDVDTPGSAKWRKLRLLSWTSQKSADAAYRSVLKATGVSWGKVTHLRKTGMEQASAHGDLGIDEIATMSKHRTNKIYRYATELYTPLMKVMAGFKRTEAYFVPRTQVELPVEWDAESIIFPHLETWRLQAASPTGDQSDAASNFLNKMLPFLARVIIQDGIFWLRDFPNHEISITLRNVMPAGYEEWARETRALVEEEVRNVIQSRTLELNAAAQASYMQLSQKVDALSQTVIDTQRELLRICQAGFSRPHVGANTIGAVEETFDEEEIPVDMDDEEIPPPPVMHPIGQEQGTALGRLRNTPVVPLIPKVMPRSMRQLVMEYEHYGGSRYERSSTRRGWATSLNLAYSRRKYLYTQLILRANALRNNNTFARRKDEAARNMDAEIRSKMLTGTSQYYSFLKSRDRNKKNRNRNGQAAATNYINV